MSRRPLVLLDVDGVLADFVTPTLAALTEITGTPQPYPLEWDFIGPLASDVRRALFGRLHAPGFCESLPVYDGAVEGVARLREIADIHVVTSPMRSPTWTHEREVWLRRHFGIDHRDVTHTGAKHLMRGDYLIDDKTENVVEWVRANEDDGGYGLLFARPYNSLNYRPSGFYRYNTWRDIADTVAFYGGEPW